MQMVCKSISARFCALLLGAVTFFASTTSAIASETPGSYVNWNFDGVTGLSDVAYMVTITRDPGHAAQVFWSNQVEFGNGHGAYAGMQTNGGAERMFLFSVWDVTEYVAGPGSYCLPFGGEGVGVSCRRMGDWKQGDTYEFHYVAEGSGWWGMTITNLNDNTSFKLGSIKVGSDTMKPGSVSWTEYFRWNDSRASCESEPFSRARFDAPIANNGTLTARITNNSVSAGCAAYSTSSNATSYSLHTNAIGNSIMAPVANTGGNCLDMTNTGKIITYACHGGDNQIWVYAHDNTLRSKNFSCAVAGNNSSVKSGSCTATRAKWQVSGTRLIESSTGKCLTAGSNGATISACNGSAAQQWTVPAREQ